MIQIEEYLIDITRKKQNQHPNTSKQQKFNDIFFKLKERNALNETIIKKYMKKINKKSQSNPKIQKQQQSLFGFSQDYAASMKKPEQIKKDYDSQLKPCTINLQIIDQEDLYIKQLQNTSHTVTDLYPNNKNQDINSLPYIHISFNNNDKLKRNITPNSKDLPSENRNTLAKQNWSKTEQYRKVGSSINTKGVKDKRYKTDKDQMLEGYKLNVKQLIFSKETVQSQKKCMMNRQKLKKIRLPTEGIKVFVNNYQNAQPELLIKDDKKDNNTINKINLEYSDYNISQKIMLPTISNNQKIHRTKVSMDNYINFNQYRNIRGNNHKEYKNIRTQAMDLIDEESVSKEMITNLFKIHTIDLKKTNQKISSNIYT